MKIINNKDSRKLIKEAQNYAIDEFLQDVVYVIGKEQKTFYLLLRQDNTINYDWDYTIAKGCSIFDLKMNMVELKLLPITKEYTTYKSILEKINENFDISKVVSEVFKKKFLKY